MFKKFLTDVLGIVVLPIKVLLMFLFVVLIPIITFYPIPLIAHYAGRESFIENNIFLITILTVNFLSLGLLLFMYIKFAKTAFNLADFTTPRELRVVLLSAAALIFFVDFRFALDYRAGDYSFITKDITVINKEYKNLAFKICKVFGLEQCILEEVLPKE